MITPERFPRNFEGEGKERPPFGEDPLITRLKEAGVPSELIIEVEKRMCDGLTGLPRTERARAVIEKLADEGKNVIVEFNDMTKQMNILKKYPER